jgi:hypothetical protein
MMQVAKVYSTTRISFGKKPMDAPITARVPMGDGYYTRYENGVLEMPIGDRYIRMSGIDETEQLDCPLELVLLEEGDEQPPKSVLLELPNGTSVALRATEDDREKEETE